MPEFFSNNASSTLASGILVGATSCDVEAGHGARWPALSTDEWCWTTLTNGTNIEIIKVTAISTDTFTIERAQQGTTARAWDAGDTIELRLTRDTMTDLQGRVDYITNLSASDYYQAQSSTDLNGNTGIWIQCLYRRVARGAPATIIGRYDATGGYQLIDDGTNFANAGVSINYRTPSGVQTSSASVTSVYDRHWIHVGLWISSTGGGAYEALIYINGTQRGSTFVGGAGGFTTADPATVFQVGNLNTIEIAGFAYKEGAAIGNPTTDQMGDLFEACYEANDLVAGGITWDHLWSVKQNTPAATWTAASGGLVLNRQGSPTVTYKTKPLWL